jgi:hypothetical protein
MYSNAIRESALTDGKRRFAEGDFEAERDSVYRDYLSTVNMTARELDEWSLNPVSREASISRAPIRRNLHLLNTSREKWGKKEVEDAKRTIGFVTRMRGAAAGQPAPGSTLSKRTISLMNWAFDPAKIKAEEPIQGVEVFSAWKDGKLIVFADPYRDIDARMAPAVRWMAQRGIMTRDQVRELARQMNNIWPEGSIESWEQVIRQRVLSLANAVNAQVVSATQTRLAGALDNGQTYDDFVKASIDTINQGGYGNAGVGYLQTVYRTENANAYGLQQQAFEALPEVDQALWGHISENARLELSRPSHIALDGKYWRKNSPASRQLGFVPFSYNCTCVLSPLYTDNPENPEYKESPDAMRLAREVVRFAEDGAPCDHEEHDGTPCDDGIRFIFPEAVDRLAKKLIVRGKPDDQAWAIAWNAHKRGFI